MDRLIYFITLAIFSMVRVLPLIVCFRMGEFFGSIAWIILPHYRKLARRNLHTAFGKNLTQGEVSRLIRKNFRTIGANIFCSIKMPAMSTEALHKVITIENKKYWDAHIASNHGQGTVVALSHFGNWELNAQIATFVQPRRAGTIYQPLRNRALDDLINRDRRSRGVMTFDRKRDLAAATAFLREGGVVGVLTDQHAGDAGIWMPFFNKLASTSPLAATLAQRAGAELIHLTIHTTAPARWTIRINPPISTKDRTPAEITYELGEQLAHEIKRSPADWFWVHNRWKLPKPAFMLARVKRGLYLPENFDIKKLTPLKLLVRSPNWLGDACMAASAIRLLKYGRPDLQLTIVSPQKLTPLWKTFPEVDHVVEIPHKASPWAVGKLLKKQAAVTSLPPFDAALLLPNSIRAGLEVWLAGIPRRIGRVGKKGRARAMLINQPFPETRKSESIIHEAEEYLEIAHWLGASILQTNKNRQAFKFASANAEQGVFGAQKSERIDISEASSAPPRQSCLAEVGFQRQYRIGICPGAEYGPAKRWPVDHFGKIMDQLSAMYQVTWVVVGVKAEEPLATKLLEGFQGSVENYVGKTSLEQLIELVGNLDLLITNDTGTMHLADIFGIPLVAIFGSTEPALTGPRGAHHKILRHRVECSPCFLRTCPIDFPCMLGITPEEVVQAVVGILEEKGK